LFLFSRPDEERKASRPTPTNHRKLEAQEEEVFQFEASKYEESVAQIASAKDSEKKLQKVRSKKSNR